MIQVKAHEIYLFGYVDYNPNRLEQIVLVENSLCLNLKSPCNVSGVPVQSSQVTINYKVLCKHKYYIILYKVKCVFHKREIYSYHSA